MTGGLALQTEESWKGFVDKEISYQGNDVEVYFEEDDFDQFLEKLDSIKTVEYVHPVMEHAWGQRVVRFYDPDYHIIEVGENMKVVCKRFSDEGMTLEEISERMEIRIGMGFCRWKTHRLCGAALLSGNLRPAHVI